MYNMYGIIHEKYCKFKQAAHEFRSLRYSHINMLRSRFYSSTNGDLLW